MRHVVIKISDKQRFAMVSIFFCLVFCNAMLVSVYKLLRGRLSGRNGRDALGPLFWMVICFLPKLNLGIERVQEHGINFDHSWLSYFRLHY